VRLITPQQPEAAPASQATTAESNSKTVQASRVLLEGADKLKELVNRPAGTDPKETAQKLGQIVEETSAKIDSLLGTKTLP
jgi:hypothetical protein